MAKENICSRVINVVKLVTVEPYLFFCLFGYTVRLVSFQSLLIDRACRNMLGYSEEVCKKAPPDTAISDGDNLYMGVMLTSSLPAMIMAIFLGSWSDKYSRKYPMVIAITGMLLESIAFAVLTIFVELSPVWYVVSGLFAGVSGGLLFNLSSAFSYLSDITDERSRPSRFAIFEFFNISAIVLGGAIGGQVFKAYGHLPVMCIAPFFFLCALFYGAFFLQETKPKVPDQSRCEMFRALFRLDNIKQSYKTCSKKRPGNFRLQIWLLIWISCCQQFTDMGALAIGFPFSVKMYHWDVTDFSNASLTYYVVNAVVTLLVVPFLSTKMHLHEAAIGLIGMLSLMSKMIVTSVAYMEVLFYIACLSGSFANCATIAIRSRLSKLVHKEELGRAFSLLGMFESTTPLIGSIVFLQIYNASLNFFPGLAFAASAIFVTPCAIMFAWMMKMPTVSLAEYTIREEENSARPLENIS